MASLTTDQELHPTNPTLSKDLNIPRENGQTRVLPDGSLLYLEPITMEEVPAVRLEDIRPMLVQEASNKLSYRFSKKRGYEDTNVTAFVKKDCNYGPRRENRPDRLFQIRSDGSKGEKPDGYVMDEGRIVLDAFDHGLRNFGHQLPMYVSSELEGHDIEDYLRRNKEISVYDLVARAPNGYYKGPPEVNTTKVKKRTKKTKKDGDQDEKPREWHEGPPRVGTFSMRATRFRLGAGCLSWEKKDGTVAKNQRILDVIPAQYKDPAVNSTKGWRDLNKDEIKKIKDGSMRKPQQGPKAKRAARAKQDLKNKEDPIEDPVEEAASLEDGDNWNCALNEQNSNPWPEYNPESFEGSMQAPQRHPMNPYSGDAWQIPSFEGTTQVNARSEPSGICFVQSRKRLRDEIAGSDEVSNLQEKKRLKFAAEAQVHHRQQAIPRIRSSRMSRQHEQRPTPESSVTPSAPASAPTGSNALNEQNSGALLENDWESFEGNMPQPQTYQVNNPQSNTVSQAPSFVDETPANTGHQQPRLDSVQPCKRTRSEIDADPEDFDNIQNQKRVRVTTDHQHHSNQQRPPRIRTSRMPREQRRPALKRYTAEGAPSAYPYPTIDGNVLGQGPLPALTDDMIHPSPLRANCAQLHTSGYTEVAGSAPPDMLYDSQQRGFGDSLPPLQIARTEDYTIQQPYVQQEQHTDSYAQPGTSHIDRADGHSNASPYLANEVPSELGGQCENVEDSASLSGFQHHGTLDYAPSWYQPQELLPSPHLGMQHDTPPTQFMEHGSKAEQPERQRATKRAKIHTANPAPSPGYENLNPCVCDTVHTTHATGFEAGTSYHGHLDAQGNPMIHVETVMPEDSLSQAGFFHGKALIGEDSMAEEQGYMPAMHSQQGMLDDFAPGPLDIDAALGLPNFGFLNQKLQDGFGQEIYPPARFHRSQWGAIPPAQSNEWGLPAG